MATLVVKKSRNTWVVVEEHYENGKRIDKTVPKISYSALGLNVLWTIEEARDHIKALNKRNRFHREEHRKIIGSSNRVKELQEIESAFLPSNLMDSFIEFLKKSSFGNEIHNKRIMSQWKTCAILIKTLKLDVTQFNDEAITIYQYFMSKCFSVDYAKKLIRVLNLWGKHVSKHRGSPYERLETPKGQRKEQIDEVYQNSPTYQGESDPLTPEHLVESKFSKIEWYNWLCISVWFGLRPIEIDSLHKTHTWKILNIKDTQVLSVYQSKLTSLEKSKRWKNIPCIYPDQVKLLDIIKSGVFKRPLLKTLHKILKTNGIDLRGGRKGFVDLMLDRDQALEDISMWLGHQSIEMTWSKYRNKKRIHWKS